jgi:hypothetical protein
MNVSNIAYCACDVEGLTTFAFYSSNNVVVFPYQSPVPLIGGLDRRVRASVPFLPNRDLQPKKQKVGGG